MLSWLGKSLYFPTHPCRFDIRSSFHLWLIWPQQIALGIRLCVHTAVGSHPCNFLVIIGNVEIFYKDTKLLILHSVMWGSSAPTKTTKPFIYNVDTPSSNFTAPPVSCDKILLSILLLPTIIDLFSSSRYIRSLLPHVLTLTLVLLTLVLVLPGSG